MKITEVRVKLTPRRSDRLRAFCSITIDDVFAVHDLRVIQGRKGLFVAMPSRKITGTCPACAVRNDLQSRFCGDCGVQLAPRVEGKNISHDDLHVDVAHPVNTACRTTLQATVLAAYGKATGAQEEPLRGRATMAPGAVAASDAGGISSLARDVAAQDSPPEGGFADGIL
jgi:stage V sporulation protein G